MAYVSVNQVVQVKWVQSSWKCTRRSTLPFIVMLVYLL